ncbi:MAG: SusD/RagB family nutrient-binding outer membrane lipoprotein [Chitinophagaceae bacterium]
MKTLQYKTIALLAILAIVATSCNKKFDDYSQNKNLPLTVPPGTILRGVLGDIIIYPGGSEDKAGQYIASNYTYYGDNKYWNGSAGLSYGSLRNVVAMETAAAKSAGSSNNPYRALGLFLRAFFFVSMTEKVGDLPMTDALQGLANTAPKYNTQKEIFAQSLKWLDSSNTILTGLLSTGFLEFSGDFYFNPSDNASSARAALVQWQKVVNSYKLRVLIELSKKVTSDADLNIKSQFNDIVSNPTKYPLLTSNADNLQYVYNSTYNYYPDNANNYGNNAGRLNVGGTYLNTLSSLNDLRAMVLAEPARGLGFADTDFRSFLGSPLGADLSYLATESGAGRLSLYNYNHYYTGYTAEPTIIVGYGEMCLNIAEAINRGWTTGSADTWYQNGIKAMFAFYGVVDGNNTVTFRNASGTANLTNTVAFSFANYFNQAAVKYKGDNSDGLTQILTQKYLAYFRNSGLQGYYLWRRTGVPTFNVGAGTGNGGVIPKRYQYPTNEATVNTANLQAAVQSQYGGSDDINAQMWLIK